MTKKIITINLLLIPTCFFLLFSCFEPEEGCLDIEANNFQLSADRDCSKDATDGCFCTYPKVSIPISHVFGESAFATNQTYQTEVGEYIRIKDIQFYISDIELVLEDNRIAKTLDTITLTIREDNGQLQNTISLDDFHLIRPNTQKIDLITTNQSGNFTKLQFSVGIKSPASTTQPNQINDSSHILAIDSMYLDQEGYVFNRLSIQPDTSSAETLLFQLTQTDSLQRVTVAFSPKLKDQGEDISINTLEIDHKKWFDGINFAENSQSDIRRKIVTNTTNVFSILQ